MKLVDGNLYFKNISKIKYKYDYLSENIKCDVLIVGGGISGALTAYYHALKGLNVVILEKNIIGFTSTSATTAIMEYQIDVDLNILSEMIGKNNAYKSYKLCEEAIVEIEKICKLINVDFKRKDSLYFSSKNKDKKLLKEYEYRKKYFNIVLENYNEILNFKNAINYKNGSGVMNSYKFTSELISYLVNNYNVSVYENTEAVDYKNKINNIIIKTDNDYIIEADKCILTTGFDARDYVKNVKFYKTFTIVTNKLDIEEKYLSFTARDNLDPYHYIRFDDGRIILGGEDIKESELNFKKHYDNLEKSLKNFFPALDCKVEYKYNGTFANTKDTLPIIDKIKPRLYCNLGYGANGILYSVIGAKLLSENKLLKIFKNR